MKHLKAFKIGTVVAMLICVLGLFTTSFAANKTALTLDKANAVMLIEEVDSMSVSHVISQILENKSPEIILYIRSPGGSVIDGAQLVNFISHSDKKITCVVDFAASMAFAITQACTTRYVLETGVLMQHMAAYSLEMMPAPNAHSFSAFVESIIKNTFQLQANRLGMSLEAFYAKTRDDWWLYGKQALDQHVVDGVVYVKCSQELLSSEIRINVMSTLGPVEVVFNGCPLITAPKSIGFGKNMTDQQRLEFLQNLDYKTRYMK